MKTKYTSVQCRKTMLPNLFRNHYHFLNLFRPSLFQTPLELHTHRITRFRWKVAFLGLILGLSALIVITWAFISNPRDQLTDIRTSRGIVIDAGSSHTSFKLFQWPNTLEDLETRPNQLDLNYTCHEPFGMDDFSSEPDIIGDRFRPCLQELDNILRNAPKTEGNFGSYNYLHMYVRYLKKIFVGSDFLPHEAVGLDT